MEKGLVGLPVEKKCEHFELCSCARDGACTASVMIACGVAIEVKELATKWPCPALPNSHCEIPHYLVLMKKGVPCGEAGKCFLAELFRGLIPPQDFTSAGKIPESYKRQRPAKKNLLRILSEYQP